MLFSGIPAEQQPPLIIVAAHPDDETIGAGAHLPFWSHARVVYVTGGSPTNNEDALRSGYSDWQSYSAARKAEAETALELCGIPANHTIWLDYRDQEVTRNLLELAPQLAALFGSLRCASVLTHPYEGGHPDHDATALGVNLACKILQAAGRKAPDVLEFTSYHNRAGIMATGEFLPHSAAQEQVRELSEPQKAFKQRLFQCYRTQQHVLQYFPIQAERFRPAPAYDFSLPPHEGTLYFELFPWGITGEEWRQLAREALLTLGCLPATPTVRERTFMWQ